MLAPMMEKLGLTPKESLVYQELLESGRSSASVLSKASAIPRATVYGILARLQELGLITVEAARGTTYYLPSSPESLLRLLDRQKQELAEREQVVKQLADAIAPLMKSERLSFPKIRLAEGIENISNMFYETFGSFRKTAQRDGDNNVYGFQDATFIEHFRKMLDWRWKTASENIYFFSNMTEAEQKLVGRVPGRNIRRLPTNVEFTSSIYAFGKHHVILVSTREKPLRALAISEPNIASNLQAVFKLMWHLTER